jgi:hypothetical protein
VRATALLAEADVGERIDGGPPATGSPVHLRVRVSEPARCEFGVSFDGRRFATLGGGFQTREHRWVGVRVGLFASAPAGEKAAGSVDVTAFRIE